MIVFCGPKKNRLNETRKKRKTLKKNAFVCSALPASLLRHVTMMLLTGRVGAMTSNGDAEADADVAANGDAFVTALHLLICCILLSAASRGSVT